MLFNSYEFLLVFFPLTLAGFFWTGRRFGLDVAIAWLSIASMAFYAWWDWRYAPLLAASITGNALAGRSIVQLRSEERLSAARHTLWLAIALNLLLLGYFKYANFFLDAFAAAMGTTRSTLDVVLPIGISFFTFTQIAYLVDAWRGEVEAFSLRRYILFVTYFPHLIAGPVLHHREMMSQFADPRIVHPRWSNLSVGASIFIIGLFKKVILADNTAIYASPLFAAARAGDPLTFFDAWLGAFAYSMQLYFDFSAYSDMAIGLSLMFGIRIPMNFNSPYQATNIIDFWRRWHLSLSRFLRDYLYIPLGGGHSGPIRQRVNLMVTMLLGGLWHGAGWTFVVWGGLHGIYLVVNHVWRTWRASLRTPTSRHERWMGAVLTFIAVLVAWVFFRADSWEAASRIVLAMAGHNGVGLPGGLGQTLPSPLREGLEGLGMSFDGMFLVRVGDWREGGAWLALTGAIAFLAPNTYRWFYAFRPALPIYGTPAPIQKRRLRWRPSPAWALCLGALFFVSFLALSRPSEFLYFQF